MSEKNIKARIVHKHDTEANWKLATNFIPKQGELIVYDVDDTHTYERFKIGDGSTVASSLPFSVPKVPFIVGTQTATTGAFTGTTSEISELEDGQTIRYWLPYSGSGNATLNLTLSDGSTTGAVNCYRTGTTRLSTQYAAGNVITMTYRKDVSIAGSTTKYTGWWCDADYSTSTASSVQLSGSIKCGTTAIVANNIIVGNNGTYSHLKLGNAFDITYPILCAGSAISASGTGSSNYLARGFAISTTQSITLTSYKPIFIKGTLSGTTFTPFSTAPLTQTVPSSEDGYDYILLGVAYSSTSMYLLIHHPIFAYKNGKFVEKSSYELPIASSSTLGGVKIGSNITNSNGTISLTSSNVTGALGYTPLNSTLKGANNGVAELDASGKVPSAQLPSHNAFSKIVVGSTTVEADSATDTLTFVAGTNGIAITADAANDKITIANTHVYNPVGKTAEMTQAVGVDSSGALYTAPSEPVSYVSTMPTADASSPSLVFLMGSNS